MKRMKILAAMIVAGGASVASAAPKNVILMISDGQGFNSVVATDNYRGSAAAYEGDGFVKYAMQTYSASRPMAYNQSLMFNGTDATFAMSNYTDSASAATAMYTGVKNYDGEVNWATNDKPLTTFFEKAAWNGMSIGAVSSVEATHATPAAVYGHNSSRNNYAAIGIEGVYGSNPLNGAVANSGSNPAAGNNGLYDSLNYNQNMTVLMGAGHGDYNSSGVYNTGASDNYVGGTAAWNDIKDGAVPNGWTFVDQKADFEAIADGTNVPSKLLGIAQVNTTLQNDRAGLAADANNPSGMAYIAGVPTLTTMTSAALNVLGQNSDGFAVMIEGGAIDWANHSNNIGRMIEEQVDFDNSVAAAIAWVEANSNWNDTLLIVTADHETGNLWGSGTYTDVNADGNYDPGIDTFNGYQQVTATGADVLTGVQYLSGDHTNALVPLYAKGAGSERFADYVIGQANIADYYGAAGFSNNHNYIDNTSIYNVMMDATAIHDIPEPASLALIALGGLTMLRGRGRRNRRA